MYFSTLFLTEAQITKKQVIFWPSYGPFLAISRGFWTPIFGNFRKITFFRFSYDFSFFTHFSWLFALHVRTGFFDSLHLSWNRCSPQLSRFNFPTWLSTTFHTHFRTPTFGHFFDPRRNFANFVLFEFAIIQLLKTGVKKAVPGGPPENGHFVHPYFRLHFSPSIWDVSWRLLSSVHHDELSTDFPFLTSLSDFTFPASPISTTDFLRRYTLFALHRLLRLLRLASGGIFFRHATTFDASQPSSRHNFLRDTTSLAPQLSSLPNFRRPYNFLPQLNLAFTSNRDPLFFTFHTFFRRRLILSTKLCHFLAQNATFFTKNVTFSAKVADFIGKGHRNRTLAYLNSAVSTQKSRILPSWTNIDEEFSPRDQWLVSHVSFRVTSWRTSWGREGRNLVEDVTSRSALTRRTLVSA